ncbi:ComEA family DNA-binding protein [Balneolales bacterium ANBcel1]|nr:ComEA family DNA-binding protein [Balneolales bacterium ANBcel1]
MGVVNPGQFVLIMFKRRWFFWMERLQITPGERRVMLSLMAVSVLLAGFSLFGPARTVYDESYYEPVLEEFHRLSGVRADERDVILARYRPGGNRPAFTASLMDGRWHPSESPLLVVRHTSDPPVKTARESGTDTRDRPQGDGSANESRVNIQIADREALMSLPGIGPAIADRIISYRESEGPFREPSDLLNVSGIGPVTLERIRDLVYVE